MTITRVKLERFTAFESLDFKPSHGVNVLVGANCTGKTHLMKVAYAACDVSKTRAGFAEKLVRTFMPSGVPLDVLSNGAEEVRNVTLRFPADEGGSGLRFPIMQLPPIRPALGELLLGRSIPSKASTSLLKKCSRTLPDSDLSTPREKFISKKFTQTFLIAPTGRPHVALRHLNGKGCFPSCKRRSTEEYTRGTKSSFFAASKETWSSHCLRRERAN